MQEQWIREAMLLGPEAVDRLETRSVAVFGVGGVGSYCAEGLARAGVGAITLIDNDTVSLSNLNRQIIALHSTLGRSKSDVMAERVRDINPACEVVSLPILYAAENGASFFEGRRFDYLVDAIDMVSSKLVLIETANRLGIPILSAMCTGNKTDPSRFRISDISKTTGCPLARVMRKELRARGIVHHTVLWSDEPPVSPLPLASPPPGRHTVPASVSWTPSCAGLMMAGYVVQRLIAE